MLFLGFLYLFYLKSKVCIIQLSTNTYASIHPLQIEIPSKEEEKETNENKDCPNEIIIIKLTGI
jgi:hypothetical protein